jgi:hypothetical protein
LAAGGGRVGRGGVAIIINRSYLYHPSFLLGCEFAAHPSLGLLRLLYAGVFALLALAVVAALESRLVALAVLLQAVALLAVAALGMLLH